MYVWTFNIVPAFERKLIPLGFALELQVGYEAIIRPRSGNSKDGIDVCIGTIDINYRGEVMACVCNTLDEDFRIEEGDRICQLAIREAPTVAWEVVEELSETERGADGFGSSGIK
jgi:dUTP pyrophosphatase